MAKSTGKRRSAVGRKDRVIPIALSDLSEFKEDLSSMVDRGGTENPFDALTKVSVAARLPLGLVAKLDALAERLKENRTEALCRLVEGGWRQLMTEVKPETVKALTELEERKGQALVDELNRK
jgi:hypothetical protein